MTIKVSEESKESGAPFSVVSTSVTRVDALEKATGKAIYTGDIEMPNMLHMKILRSPYPHAKIVNIDTSAARKVAGVQAVLTGEDAPSKRWGVFLADRPLLAQEVVRFVGEPVAAVSATTIEAAEEAIDAIDVEYEELPAIFDPELAISKEPSVIVHPDLSNYPTTLTGFLRPHLEPDMPNVLNHYKIRSGDTDQGFKEADLVVENKYTTARIQHCYIEPPTVIVLFDLGDTLTVWSKSQTAWRQRATLIDIFGLPPSKVRFITPYVGGGFGGLTWMQEALVSLLAMRTPGRPVKLVLNREEVFVDSPARIPFVVYVKDGVKKDGTIVAREIKMILDAGPYSAYTGLITKNACFGAVGTYRIPNFKLDSYGVYTNRPPNSSFRGLGSAQSNWAVESQMDEIAERLGMDRVEVRRKNVLHEGERNVQGEIAHSVGTEECLDKTASLIRWDEKPEQEPGPWRKGKGIALGNKYTIAGTDSCALVKVREDGAVNVFHSGSELGQGCDTVFTQVAAEEMGLPVDMVKITRGDTDITPYDWGTASSRLTFYIGNAVRMACQDAKRQIAELASERLRMPAKELEVNDNKIYQKGKPDAIQNVPELFRSGGYVGKGAEIVGRATFSCPISPEDMETGQGERMVAYFCYGAHAVELAVNTETGEVKIIRFVGAFDMGRPINPKMCEQQMEGGMSMGIGSTLYEETVVEDGIVMNPTFVSYKIPTIMEHPLIDNARFAFAPAPHREGPFGAKGLGEGVLTPSAPAIASAIHNALGIRFRDIPITREKVMRALEEAGLVGSEG